MEKEIGKVIHFFDKISVAVIKLTDELKIGDTILIKGKTTDITQEVKSIQLEHEDIKSGKKDQEVAVKIDGVAREGDLVYK